jgi:hypothetical protein
LCKREIVPVSEFDSVEIAAQIVFPNEGNIAFWRKIVFQFQFCGNQFVVRKIVLHLWPERQGFEKPETKCEVSINIRIVFPQPVGIACKVGAYTFEKC